VDPKIPSDLRDRLAGLPDDPNRPLTELGSYFRRVSGITLLIGDASTPRGDALGMLTPAVFANQWRRTNPPNLS
jgi:hypothetical protein